MKNFHAGVALKVPAKTVQEFIALAKKDPDKYSFGSGSQPE